MSTFPAMSVDLKTTCSIVSVFKYDKMEIIAKDYGNRRTPSCVPFAGKERLIGKAVMNHMHKQALWLVY
ncbi:Heat shock protein cognate [Echinococcus granulosus]|uniref:Heat shock protein cognate n=1 Tax=Echinococcus granulosus TaxID=6210 RepID=W6U9L9_ECHGR|nr:Heat shock protein cognate [Echinococcus granulosus]EUB55192.1 Heat shock protein cognate [Echinococcus granulosus]